MTVVSWGIAALGMLVCTALCLIFGYTKAGGVFGMLTLAAMIGFAVTAGRLG